MLSWLLRILELESCTLLKLACTFEFSFEKPTSNSTLFRIPGPQNICRFLFLSFRRTEPAPRKSRHVLHSRFSFETAPRKSRQLLHRSFSVRTGPCRSKQLSYAFVVRSTTPRKSRQMLYTRVSFKFAPRKSRQLLHLRFSFTVADGDNSISINTTQSSNRAAAEQ